MVTLLRNQGVNLINVTVVTDKGTRVDQFDLIGDFEYVMYHPQALHRNRLYIITLLKAVRLEAEGK